jgi:taurine dioxygenase
MSLLQERTPASVDGYERIDVEPLTPTVGAYVRGVDLGNLDDQTWDEVQRAFANHSVLFFRGQQLTADQLEDVGRRLGPLHLHPAAPTLEGHPHVMRIHADENSKVVAGSWWHTDVSCDERPPLATMLYMHTLPPVGGDTLFSSQYAAYEALSPAFQQLVEGLTARHESRHIYEGRYGSDEKLSRDGAFPSAVHPVTRTHPVTGRKALFVNRVFTTKIVELQEVESRSVLDTLYWFAEHATFQCRFRWEKNSVAMWDNRALQHLAIWDYFPQVRSGWRVSIVGERPA